VKRVFLFSELGEASPVRAALRHAGVDLQARLLRGTFIDCPIAMPPDFVVVEPAPHRNLTALAQLLSQHPVVGRVPWLLVVDPERLHLTASLPCSDFVTRGFEPAELQARCERLLARKPEPERWLRTGPLAIDLRGMQALCQGQPLRLTPQEFGLLRHLAQHDGRAFAREALLTAVWGEDYTGSARTVDIHVRRLRAKLGDAAMRLQTVREVGYRWLG
jgi:hypothetical protein